jgi:oligoribonuclease NrnB/cAMP/cGMP phosphodiesterase (DHH superfamily)
LGEITAVIKHFEEEPAALLVIGVLGALKVIDLLIKYVPQWLKIKLPAYKWQEFVSKEIGDIKLSIDGLSNTIATHEYLINKTSEGTLVNQLFSEELSLFMRLKAFRRLLAKAKNGTVWEEGFKLLLKNNIKAKEEDKETVSKWVWRAVRETELGFEIVDKKYYNARMKEINTKIFEGFM